MNKHTLGSSDDTYTRKLPVPVKDCPECGRPFVPTPKSKDICIFCKTINERKTKPNM